MTAIKTEYGSFRVRFPFRNRLFEFTAIHSSQNVAIIISGFADDALKIIDLNYAAAVFQRSAD